MYLERLKARRGGKVYTQTLLRESYREPGAPRSRVKHRTLLNLSRCPEHVIAAVEWAVKNKADIHRLQQAAPQKIRLQQGQAVGAVWVAAQVARRLGLDAVLGGGREGRLALWQVIARLIDQGSRLSAARLAHSHAAGEILGLDSFNEDDLYENLAWLAAHQEKIERKLFAARHGDQPPELFLYDVTSSYLEGECNELAAFGYNRDGKRGKLQIVVGLLCDAAGEPVSVEVFEGNTGDVQTFGAQVQKAAERFGCARVTFVGDRGMIKSGGIEELAAAGFHYITAITKPQIETLIKTGAIQLGLFDDKLCEVEHDGVRYVLRRNPARAAELAESRADKLAALEALVEKKNAYLAAHARAQVAIAERDVKARAEQLRLEGWTNVAVEGRTLRVEADAAALAEAARLDGCYVIKTDLPRQAADAQTVHDRYKDLTEVEQAFRTMKTAQLELRPIYVRKAASTRGHALVVMLAYLIRRELARCWSDLDCTVEEGLDELKSLCAVEVDIAGIGKYNEVPAPREFVAQLFASCAIDPLKILPASQALVATRRKLPSRRKK